MGKVELSRSEVLRLIAAVNAKRLQSKNLNTENCDEEQSLNAIFETNNTLAVYGTLAPGKSNHHVVEPLGGEWTDGLIEGDLQETGWGASLDHATPEGYPAFRPREGGPLLPIRVLKSSKLSEGWEMVDEFEGHEYQRVLVPVFNIEDREVPSGDRRLYTVANLYAARTRP